LLKADAGTASVKTLGANLVDRPMKVVKGN
jgi:hypothetical protein